MKASKTRQAPTARPVVKQVSSGLLFPTAKDKDAGLQVTTDGIVIMPDGNLRAIIEVETLNFECRSEDDQDVLAIQLGLLANTLAPKQTLEIVVENRPVDSHQVLDDLFKTLNPRSDLLRQQYLPRYRVFLERTLVNTHVADKHCYLIISPSPSRFQKQGATPSAGRRLASLRQSVQTTSEALHSMGLTENVLSRDKVLQLLWRSINGEHRICPVDELRALAEAAEDLSRPGSTPKSFGSRLFTGSSAPVQSSKSKAESDVEELLLRLSASRSPQNESELNADRTAASALKKENGARAHIASQQLLQRMTSVNVIETHDRVQIDGRFAKSMFLLNLPEQTWPGWFDPFVSLNLPSRISVHIEGLDQRAERKKLKRKRSAINVISTGATRTGGVSDIDAESSGGEATRILYDMIDPSVSLMKVGVYLTVFADSEEQLDDRMERVMNLLQMRSGDLAGGFNHQLPLWQSTLPVGFDVASRRYRWRTETLGDSFPFMSHSPGTLKGYPLGFSNIGQELVLLDPADPSHPNALGNILGRSGSGKTFLAQKLALYMLLLGGRVTVVDRAGHYETLRQLIGGSLARLGEDGVALNIWDYTGAAPDRRKVGYIVDAHEVMLVNNPGERLDSLTRSYIEEGVKRVYARHKDGSFPLERELVEYFEYESTRRQSADEAMEFRKLAAGLYPYVRDGQHSSWVDRPTSVDIESDLLVFDIGALGNTPTNKHALALFMIAEATERRARSGGAAGINGTIRMRELLVIDEGWFLVKYAGAGAWLETLARQGRHWGLFLLFITQQLSDLVQDEVAASLFNAASIQCLFKQKDEQKGTSSLDWLSGTLGLSQEEVRQMQQLTQRDNYVQMFLMRESKDSGTTKRGIVRITANPIEYWMFTSDPRSDVPARRRMIAACNGDVWQAITRLASGERAADVASALLPENMPNKIPGAARNPLQFQRAAAPSTRLAQ